MLLPTLYKECSDYLRESKGLPLLKNLSVHYDGFKKVKVRKKNKHDATVEAFNKSFPKHKNAFQRSIFANTESTFMQSVDLLLEPFYIFPVDGYKFVYNPQVSNFANQYGKDIQNLINTVSKSAAIDMISMVIAQSYTDKNLYEGMKSGAEIILYGIPYYYAIRKSLVDDYNALDYNA